MPWAVKVGREASFLMNVYYEEEFGQDINELRNRLNITLAPSLLPIKK